MFHKVCVCFLVCFFFLSFFFFLSKEVIYAADNFPSYHLVLRAFTVCSFQFGFAVGEPDIEEGVGSSGNMSCPKLNPFHSFPDLWSLCLWLPSSRVRPPTHLPGKHQADKHQGQTSVRALRVGLQS